MNRIKPKSGWKKFYADVMKYYGTGYGSLLGRFSGIINLALLASTYLLVKGFELSFTESVFAGVGILVFILISGYLYVKLGLLKAESASTFIENPQQFEMYQSVLRIEKKLDSILPKEDDPETKRFKEIFQ